jgi:ABC-2 type transport system permease protein
MNDLKLLLKYSFKNKNRPKPNKKGKVKEMGVFTPIFQYIMPALLFGLTLAPVMYMSFKNLNIPLADMGIDSNFNFLDFMFSTTFLGLGVFFFLNFSPSIIVNLFDSDMTKLHLVMPVKKSTIFFATAIDSFVMAALPLGMLIPIIVVYSIILKVNIFFAIMATIGFVLFLVAISLLGGVIMSFFMGKTAAKRFAMLSYFGSVILYVFAANFMSPDRFATDDLEAFVIYLTESMNFLLHNFWPHTWFIKAMNGDILNLLILLGIGIGLIIFIVQVSNKLDLIAGSKKVKNKAVKIKQSKFPIIFKDIKLLVRDAQSIFMLLYPIILPVIFSFTGMNSLTFITIFFVMISSFYSSYLTVLMLVEETKIWPIPKLYPVKINNIVNSKIYIPVSIFFLEYVAIYIVLSIMNRFEIIGLVFMIPMLIILYYSSLIGAGMYLKNPKRDVKQKNILSGKEVLGLEAITMIFSLIIFILLNLYVEFLKVGPFWIFENIHVIFSHLILLVLPIVLLIMIIIFSVKELKKIESKLKTWE